MYISFRDDILVFCINVLVIVTVCPHFVTVCKLLAAYKLIVGNNRFYVHRDKNTVYHGMVNDPPNVWQAQAPAMEPEGDTMSSAQRSTQKWEKEEALGEMATVAPVLYTNVNFPHLKEEFPGKMSRNKHFQYIVIGHG